MVRARSGASRAKRAEIEEPVATSIGAWRVYRDPNASASATPIPSIRPTSTRPAASA